MLIKINEEKQEDTAPRTSQMDTGAGCRRIGESFIVMNAYTAGYCRHSISCVRQQPGIRYSSTPYNKYNKIQKRHQTSMGNAAPTLDTTDAKKEVITHTEVNTFHDRSSSALIVETFQGRFVAIYMVPGTRCCYLCWHLFRRPTQKHTQPLLMDRHGD